jgi:hypothetical protein
MRAFKKIQRNSCTRAYIYSNIVKKTTTLYKTRKLEKQVSIDFLYVCILSLLQSNGVDMGLAVHSIFLLYFLLCPVSMKFFNREVRRA